jgi:CIC family chloride channel protein
VLEILMLDISMKAIIPLLISSGVATTLVLFLKGFDPMLAVNVGGTFRLEHLHMYVLLAVVCGLIAFYFTYVNGRVQSLFEKFPQWKRWLLGGVILGGLIFLFPPLYGEGYGSFTALMHGRIDELFNNSLFYQYRGESWVVLLFLAGTLFMKVIAMSVTNAAGGVGGTFAPSLFVGAFTGGSLAFVFNTWLGMELSVVNFSLVGMAGVMTGVMKAPLTSVFLIAELSNGYGLFVPLMIVASLSYAISYWFEPDSIYTK